MGENAPLDSNPSLVRNDLWRAIIYPLMVLDQHLQETEYFGSIEGSVPVSP